MLPKQTVEQLLELSDKATGGEWEYKESEKGIISKTDRVICAEGDDYSYLVTDAEDVALIVQSRNNIEQLCRDNLKMREALGEARTLLTLDLATGKHSMTELALKVICQALADDAEDGDNA